MDFQCRRSVRVAFVCSALAIVAAAARPAYAQGDHAGHASDAKFGAVHFEISCSAAAQQEFDRGIAMLHSFFYPETEKAFRAIADREPSCAMAHWGVAISQRPNPLTAPFPPDLLSKGWDAVQKARAATQATAREREWIEALALFFQDYDRVSQDMRTSRYEAAMSRLRQRYPDDSEAQVFYALALLEAVDLSDKKYSKQLEAAGILERVQQSQPQHPGVVHYIIHSYDYAPIAAKGLPAARRYAALAPSAPHALHMPSHIFSTLGMWTGAIDSNLAADAANKAYAASTNPAAAKAPATITGRYHALDFLTNAYLQLAQDTRAKAILDERNSLETIVSTTTFTAHTAFAAIPVRYAIERAAWKEAAALPPMKTPFKQAEAIIWFGRALGAARSGDAASSRQAQAELSRLRQELAAAGDPYWAEQVGIQEAAASAWIAFAGGNASQAIGLMQNAADREDRSEKHVGMENRLSPMRELLGELLLAAGKPKEAVEQFDRSLKTIPNRFRSLAGAGDAAAAAGNRRLAVSYYEKLLALTANGDTERPALAAARKYVRGDRP